MGQKLVQHRRKADQGARSSISTTLSLQVVVASPTHPKKPTLHNDEITLFSHKGKGSIFCSAFSCFHCVQRERELSLQMERRNRALRRLCKCHVVPLKTGVFNHSRPAIFSSLLSSDRRKKHLEATGVSRVVWKTEGCGGLYRNTSSIKTNAVRNQE